MAHTILLEVVTPEHLLLSRQVEEVIAPGVEGEFGVLPGHTHFSLSSKLENCAIASASRCITCLFSGGLPKSPRPK